MRYNTSFLIFTLCTAYIAHGMSLPLSTIEKQIFLRKVKSIGGKSAALHKIEETKDPQISVRKKFNGKEERRLERYSCFTITTEIYAEAEDEFSQLVINTIKKKENEQKDNFDLPEHLEQDYLAVDVYGTQKLYPQYKFLENYTRYQHLINRIDEPYIELISTFNNKQALLDVLHNEE